MEMSAFAHSKSQWEVKTDDYGRTYHANWETGEAVYDPPPEMGYRPPLGRNELGEKVDPRLQALRQVVAVMAVNERGRRSDMRPCHGSCCCRLYDTLGS